MGGRGHPPLDELAALLARFGMIVGLNTSPDVDKELQTVQPAHAVEAVLGRKRTVDKALSLILGL
ncbi:MAG: hypothetical protein ACRDY0_11345 [Acidimicrobiales bacterium]